VLDQGQLGDGWVDQVGRQHGGGQVRAGIRQGPAGQAGTRDVVTDMEILRPGAG
jgi:hypothetical protein